MTKREVIQIRCSEEEKLRWGSAAKDSGSSLTDWIRDALDATIEFVGEDNPRDSLIGRGVLSTSKDDLVDAAKLLVNKKIGGCSFFSPRGTKCKVCGKVHS